MPGHSYTADISWTCEGDFIANRYSRGHTWAFDGGTEVAASASPTVVPLPYSVEAAVDPEEAFIAALSSCHMLWFLDLARQKGWRIAAYRDRAVGVMERVAKGKMAVTKVTLRPEIRFLGEVLPHPAEVDAVHHEAHERCFIANSVTSEIVVEQGEMALADA